MSKYERMEEPVPAGQVPYAGALPPVAGPQEYPSQQSPQIQAPVSAYQHGLPASAPGQQQQLQWMSPPSQAVPGCPPGLEYLTLVDQLLIHQQVELFEVLTDIETVNRYQIKNSMGQQVYFAHEESGFCERQCCGPLRGFQMHVTDNTNQEVMRLVREFKCCAGCCWCASAECCAMELAIEAPVGHVIGYIQQTQSWWYPHYDVLNVDKEPILKIRGPGCIIQGVCCTGDLDFNILDFGLTAELGKVSKQWGGYIKEVFSKADNFSVSFPMDLSVEMKACLLGAVFLIDFMYFERRKQKKNR